jgi:hypothetical protein
MVSRIELTSLRTVADVNELQYEGRTGAEPGITFGESNDAVIEGDRWTS